MSTLGGKGMKRIVIAATLAGSLNCATVAEETHCTKPIASHDTVPTQIVRLWLSREGASKYYWQAMTRDVLDDSNGDIRLATERLTQQLKGSFYNSLPLTESFWSQLLEHSLSEVDWHGIAKQLIAEFNRTAH